jgi:hypothetical protein
MAASLAAKLRNELDVCVETIPGGFGEFTVLLDGQEVVRTSRFWFPSPTRVLQKVKSCLGA